MAKAGNAKAKEQVHEDDEDAPLTDARPYRGELAAYKVMLAIKANGQTNADVERVTWPYVYRGQLTHSVMREKRGMIGIDALNQIAIVINRPIAYLANNAIPASEPIPQLESYAADPGRSQLNAALPHLIPGLQSVLEDLITYGHIAAKIGEIGVGILPVGTATVDMSASLTRAQKLRRVEKLLLGEQTVRGAPRKKPEKADWA